MIRHNELFHVTVADFLCDHCNTHFTLRSNLNRHQDAAHNKDGSFKHVCDECNETFCTGKDLRQHNNKLHVNFVCESCGEHFKRKSSLLKHIKNMKPLKCSECGK